MRDEFFAFGEREAVHLTGGGEGHEAAARYVRGAPVGGGEVALEAWGRGESVACPGEEGVALGDYPVGCAVEVEDGEGRRGGFGGY